MAAAFTAYAAKVSNALQELIATTHVEIEPAVDFVSCGSGLNEHFVPKTSLEKHLRKCHGEQRHRPIHDAAFCYGRRKEEDAVDSRDTHTALVSGIAGSRVQAKSENIQGNNCELQSLLEPEAVWDEEPKARHCADDEDGVTAAVRKRAVSAGHFYEQVQSWQRIPRAFATIKDSERKLVTALSLRRWLTAELSRPGVLPKGEPLDNDLIDYVAGLLDHPDFCRPDVLVLELHEFLGSNVSNIVLALWKFLVVEIALQSVFKTEERGKDMAIRVKSMTKSHDSTTVSLNLVPKCWQKQLSDANTEHDYKRRRASYRGKVGTKTGLAAYRDMIQKHMVGISLEMDWELVLGGGFESVDDCGKGLVTGRQARPEAANWFDFTDALEVRNRGRQRQEDERVSKKRRSRSRSKSKRVRMRGADEDAWRASTASHDRSGSKQSRRTSRSRSRSRSRRVWDHKGSKHRHSSRRKEQDENEHYSGRRGESRH